MNDTFDNFKMDNVDPNGDTLLVVDLDGYEGPIDMLLDLARQQKVDLLNISILRLAEQYLKFIEEAHKLKLEIAADYLVMAAWLAYLKSRLLLPEEENDEELSGPQMADALAFQLRRLQAMQEAGSNILQLPRLGKDIFARGFPEGIKVIRTPVYELSLFELLKAYGDHRSKGTADPLEIAPTEFYSVDDALERLTPFLGKILEWSELQAFLPESVKNDVIYKSIVASTFAASLELVKSGQLEIRQSDTFSPIYFRSKSEGVN
tara:strand:+ start:383 stop:1171 length:789 start_codon:yes stop_codon:yes gene_type:complete